MIDLAQEEKEKLLAVLLLVRVSLPMCEDMYVVALFSFPKHFRICLAFVLTHAAAPLPLRAMLALPPAPPLLSDPDPEREGGGGGGPFMGLNLLSERGLS